MSDYIHLPRAVAEYARTALKGSSDNGDQYCAAQIQEFLDAPPQAPIFEYKEVDRLGLTYKEFMNAIIHWGDRGFRVVDRTGPSVLMERKIVR